MCAASYYCRLETLTSASMTASLTWAIYSACECFVPVSLSHLTLVLPRYSLNKSVLHPSHSSYQLLTRALTLSAHTPVTQSAYSILRYCISLRISLCRLYKIVFPNGLDAYDTPSASNPSSRQGSLLSVAAHQVLASPTTPTSTTSASSRSSGGFFSRLGLSRAATPSGATTPTSIVVPAEDGPIEHLVVSGTAFGTKRSAFFNLHLETFSGHGLFNLVLSLLPAKVKCVTNPFFFVEC